MADFAIVNEEGGATILVKADFSRTESDLGRDGGKQASGRKINLLALDQRHPEDKVDLS